ncbi:MAG TPA: FAD-dependent oxidoreductase [Sandaracinaceae bacterium]
MTTIDVDVAVIGGGPAGAAAAREAARAGAAVALVDADGAGGRAARATALPLRAMSAAADRGAKDWPALRAEVEERARAWTERARLGLDDAGVEVLEGRARFVSPNALALDDGRRIAFERAVIAAGARPAALPGAEPDGARLLVPDQLASLPALPAEAMVIGGGAAGAEIVDVLSRLGTRVTWITDELGILPRFDRELARVLADVLAERGVKLVHGQRALELGVGAAGATAKLDGGRTYAAPVAIVAAGSTPSTSGLGLGALGLNEGSRIAVDAFCRTEVPHVFAAGDVTGLSHDVASAEAMGRAAGRGAAGEPVAFMAEHAPRVVHTRPEIAQVGLGAEALRGREVVLYTLRLEETLGGHLAHIGESPSKRGFVRLVCDSESDRLLGASALGPGAADAIGAVAIALTLGATSADLARASAAVPSALDAVIRSVR